MKPTTPGSHPKKLVSPTFATEQKKVLIYRLKLNHRKQAKINIVSHFSPSLGFMVLNFSNPSILTHETADIKLA